MTGTMESLANISSCHDLDCPYEELGQTIHLCSPFYGLGPELLRILGTSRERWDFLGWGGSCQGQLSLLQGRQEP